MGRPKVAAVTLAALFFALMAVVAETYHRLPERVATHFSVRGVPDGWMSRPAHAAFVLATAAFVSLVASGATLLTRFLGDRTINLPHRDYWLAPERRRATLDRLLTFGLWLSCLCVVLMIGLQFLVVRANLRNPPRLPIAEGGGLLAAFLIATLALTLLLLAPFLKVPPDSRTGDPLHSAGKISAQPKKS